MSRLIDYKQDDGFVEIRHLCIQNHIQPMVVWIWYKQLCGFRFIQQSGRTAMVCIFSIRTGYACLIWLVHIIFALAVTPTPQITSSSSATDRTTMIYNKSKHIGQGRQLAKPTSHEQVSFVWRLYVHFLLLTKAYMYVHVLLRCQNFLEARFCGGSTPKFRYHKTLSSLSLKPWSTDDYLRDNYTPTIQSGPVLINSHETRSYPALKSQWDYILERHLWVII